ncbi:MAG: hypothetical protein JWR75_2014 [Devosia sp.]|nr:hypothetical protein [Devosia sp.]
MPRREAAMAAPVRVADTTPLLRLAKPQAGESEAFLGARQLEAAVRLQGLFRRAALMPRLTMSYDAVRIPGGGGGGNDLSDSAATARKQLNTLVAGLPGDCAGVVLDVCGFGKGLAEIEAERRWPRRSAKFLLRAGLDALARQWGLDDRAVGPASRRLEVFIGEGGLPTDSVRRREREM